MVLQYNIDKISTALEDFYLATGVNINLFNENFELINALAIDMKWNNQIQCESVEGNTEDSVLIDTNYIYTGLFRNLF